MRNVLIIARKEIYGYFTTPLAYIIAAVFLAVSGVFFISDLGSSEQARMTGFLFGAIALLTVIGPLLTMRLFAEEQKLGTLELLLTAPVREAELVLGKFLAALTILISMLVMTFFYPMLLVLFAQPDLGPVVSGYVGLLLFGAAFLAVGLLASSVTSNQILAAVLGLGLLGLLWLVSALSGVAQSVAWAKDIVNYVALTNVYVDFLRGLLDTREIIFLISLTAVVLFATTRAVEARRWR